MVKTTAPAGNKWNVVCFHSFTPSGKQFSQVDSREPIASIPISLRSKAPFTTYRHNLTATRGGQIDPLPVKLMDSHLIALFYIFKKPFSRNHDLKSSFACHYHHTETNQIKLDNSISTCSLEMFFLNETVSWIPDMFPINHRQNCAVKTQTGREAPGPGLGSHALKAQLHCPPFSSQTCQVFLPTASACRSLTHTPPQRVYYYYYYYN